MLDVYIIFINLKLLL